MVSVTASAIAVQVLVRVARLLMREARNIDTVAQVGRLTRARSRTSRRTAHTLSAI
jgi:hypothetical protein